MYDFSLMVSLLNMVTAVIFVMINAFPPVTNRPMPPAMYGGFVGIWLVFSVVLFGISICTPATKLVCVPQDDPKDDPIDECDCCCHD